MLKKQKALQSLSPKSELEDEYIKFEEDCDALVEKYGSIVYPEAVMDMIELVMSNSYTDSTVISTGSEENDNSVFVFVDGTLIALADYSYVEDLPVLYLSFHVATLSNTAIKMNRLIDKAVEIPVISTNLFYPVNTKDDTTILYNKAAIEEYQDCLSDTLYDIRKKRETNSKLLKKLDKTEMH